MGIYSKYFNYDIPIDLKSDRVINIKYDHIKAYGPFFKWKHDSNN